MESRTKKILEMCKLAAVNKEENVTPLVEEKLMEAQNDDDFSDFNLSFSLENFEVETSGLDYIVVNNDHDYLAHNNVFNENFNNDTDCMLLENIVITDEVVDLVQAPQSPQIEENVNLVSLLETPHSPLIEENNDNLFIVVQATDLPQQNTETEYLIDIIPATGSDVNVSDDQTTIRNLQVNSPLHVGESIPINATLDQSNESTSEHIIVDNAEEGEQSRVRKRTRHTSRDDQNGKKKSKRSDTKECRMLGKSYTGYKRQHRKITHDTERGSREKKPTCSSNKCKLSKNRFCNSFTEEQRKELFEKFWQCTWEEKQTFVINMVRKTTKKRETVGVEETRRSSTYEYYLKYANNEMKQVCKSMFLGTLALNEWMVKNWVDKSEHGLPYKEKVDEEKEDEPNVETDDFQPNRALNKKVHLQQWIDSLPKLESHYCRKDSKRLYLEGPFNTKQEIYELYKVKCKNDRIIPLTRTSVMKTFETNKISIFKPRKDQCDTCIMHKTKQISEEEYQQHIKEKDRAREEKEKDKIKAKDGLCFTFTMDLQSVNLCPKTNASALYYSMKLKVYNLTIFNVGSSQCSTYWWNECEGELEASVFTSVVIKHILSNCIPFPEQCDSIVLYSDGCGYQNRNQYLSNALLNFSIEHNVTIEQKYLVKGHSQMECDSAHALIERKSKDKDIHLPSDYLKIAKDCKKNKPYYDAVLLDHTYFLDYSDKAFLVYKSIRPGKTAGDPAVKDIRCLKYNPIKRIIEYKLCFDEDYKELPQRQNKTNFAMQQDYKKLYTSQIPLTLSKFQDLQKLKQVLPTDTHSFYDSLPHATKFVKTTNKVI